jgi:hypothetical protein
VLDRRDFRDVVEFTVACECFEGAHLSTEHHDPLLVHYLIDDVVCVSAFFFVAAVDVVLHATELFHLLVEALVVVAGRRGNVDVVLVSAVASVDFANVQARLTGVLALVVVLDRICAQTGPYGFDPHQAWLLLQWRLAIFAIKLFTNLFQLLFYLLLFNNIFLHSALAFGLLLGTCLVHLRKQLVLVHLLRLLALVEFIFRDIFKVV